MEIKSEKTNYKIPTDYYNITFICAAFVALAFMLDTPQNILNGLYEITTARSVLITDYVEMAGIGAALVNAAIQVLFNIALLVFVKCKPSGRTIASLFLTIGFSLFGKNMFNTLPIMMGVWIYGRVSVTKVDSTELVVLAMVASTVAPIVSEIAFINGDIDAWRIFLACAVGVFVGFIFPVITAHVKKMHNNFCLYNGGIAGGFIATMFAGLFRSMHVEIVPEYYWSSAYTTHLSLIAYVLAAALILYGLLSDKSDDTIARYRKLINERNQMSLDFYVKYGKVCYINIGVMCMLSTSVMLAMGIPINGPVLGAIFTVTGFAAAGKHIKNTVPILIGSIAATHFNYIEAAAPVNILAILFSTGLAPIAGRYGWGWGVITGFSHVLIAVFIGDINGGLNLYNNGFAGSFVAVMILPVITLYRHVKAIFIERVKLFLHKKK